MRSLIQRCREGNEQAFTVIVDRYKDMAYGYAYSILGDFHLAEDAAQESFVEAWLSLPNLRNPVAFPTWLKRIVHKQCDRIRRRKSLSTIDVASIDSIPDRYTDPATTVIRDEERTFILDAVSSLSGPKRAVVMMFYIGGYSLVEVGDFLGIPVGTVKSRLFEARKILKVEMIEMVEDTMKTRGLPDGFAKETVQLAVENAKKLHAENNYEEAEGILRSTLTEAPDHPDVLKELNRNLMRGHVYGKADWSIMPEIALQGRKIVDSGRDDEYVYHETAQTLLSTPKMPEAVDFIESSWIPKSGTNIEKLCMLAWALSCTADYEGARNTWDAVLALANDESRNSKVGEHIPPGCKALVDAFVSAGRPEPAKEIAQQGWQLCSGHGDHV